MIKNSFYPHLEYDLSYINNLKQLKCKHGLTGSQNFGNTCYINSAIACLSNSIELTNYFLTKQYKNEINTKNKHGLKGKLVNEWYNLLHEYWEENNDEYLPYDFRIIMGKIDNRFIEDEQQDSFEFLSILIDKIHEELNCKNSKMYIQISEQQFDESNIECALRFWTMYINRNESIITDLFTGQFKSITKCPDCKCNTITYDTFNTLTLPIPDKNFLKKYNANMKYRDTQLYFIPQFGLGDTILISFCLPINAKLCDVSNYLNKINDFNSIHKVNSLDFMIVENNLCKGILSKNLNYFNNNNYYYFCCENDDCNCDIILPLYIDYSCQKKKCRIVSNYPRFLYVHNNMKYNIFLKKIYYFVRKYIKNPFDKENDEVFENTYNLYISNPCSKENLLFELLDEEYINIFEKPVPKSNEFLKKLPFNFYIKNKKNKIRLLPKDKNKLIESLVMNQNNDINNIIKLLNDQNKDDRYTLNLCLVDTEFTKENIKLNNKINMKSKDYGNDNYEYSNKINLIDCFNYFMKEETLDKGNEWYCKYCKKSKLAKKKIELFYLPKLLIICLKRFSNNGRNLVKNSEYVDFLINDMDLTEIVSGPEKKISKYDLYAVCRHYGNYYEGHYTAVCKNFGKWYKYDDSKVSELNDEKIVSNDAYVLFYRRQFN